MQIRGRGVVTRWLLAALLLPALLAGCASSGAAPQEAPPASAVKADAFKNADPRDAGEIVGRILDEEVRPLPAVTVRILGTDVATETTQDGIFYFQKVPARTYTLSISKFGFETKNQSVVVASLQRSTVEVVLRQAADLSAWTDTGFVFRGHINCSVRGNLSGVNGMNTNPECGAYQEQVDQARQRLMDVLPGVRWLLVELQWTPTVPGPNDKLTLAIRPLQGESWKQIQGPSVLRYMVTPSDFEAIKKYSQKDYVKLGGQIQLFVFPGESVSQGGAGVGATIQQDFTIYGTAWYRMDPPEGFSRLPK